MDIDTVFVDTVGWVALVHRRDSLHQQAARLYKSLAQAMKVTTDAVLIETCNSFSRGNLRQLALAFMDKIAVAGRVSTLEVIHVSEDLITESWELFKKHKDKDWSLTDCISFEIMRRRGIKKAISADHHFVQAGFENLL